MTTFAFQNKNNNNKYGYDNTVSLWSPAAEYHKNTLFV